MSEAMQPDHSDLNQDRQPHPPVQRDLADPRLDRAPGGGGDSYGEARAVVLELLEALEGAAAGSPREFYDRVCRGICELTEMSRCALLLYDEREKRVLPAGSSGIDEAMLGELHGTLEETPIAAEALGRDQVVITQELADAIPPRHRKLPGVVQLACVPVAAGDRWLGVLLGDRAGAGFEVDEAQRDLIWGLGKTVALAASTRIAASQQQRARLLEERIRLAREVHDRVMQRLFGLSLVLGSGEQLSSSEQERAAEELRTALEELRDLLQQTREPPRAPPSPSLRQEVERLSAHYPHLRIDRERVWADPAPEHEGLAQSVLAEALHNLDKHATPRRVQISANSEDGAWRLEIVNDGASVRERASAGMGLQLASLDALQSRGVLEFGPVADDRWRVCLVLPRGERA